MYKYQIKPKGFTILESLIAISILIVSLAAVVQFFPLSLKVFTQSKNQTIASNIAAEAIESLNSINYEDIFVGSYQPRQRVSEDTSSYLYPYESQIDVEYVDSNLSPISVDQGLKKITVSVFWLAPFGGEKSTSIYSLKASY